MLTYTANFVFCSKSGDPAEKVNATAKALEMSLQYNFVTPLTSMVVTKPETEETGPLIADKLTEGGELIDLQIALLHSVWRNKHSSLRYVGSVFDSSQQVTVSIHQQTFPWSKTLAPSLVLIREDLGNHKFRLDFELIYFILFCFNRGKTAGREEQ